MTARPCMDCRDPFSGHGYRCPACAVSAARRRGTTTARGYGVPWQRLGLSILERDGWRCRWCGAAASDADHLKAKLHGGSDDPTNLVASCSRCNGRRGGRIASR